MDFLPEFLVSFITVIGIPVIVQLVKIWREKLNPGEELQQKVITVIVFAFSFIAAMIYAGVHLPPFNGDPIQYLFQLLAVGSVFFTAVKAVYDFILKSIFEKLGWN